MKNRLYFIFLSLVLCCSHARAAEDSLPLPEKRLGYVLVEAVIDQITPADGDQVLQLHVVKVFVGPDLVGQKFTYAVLGVGPGNGSPGRTIPVAVGKNVLL